MLSTIWMFLVCVTCATTSHSEQGNTLITLDKLVNKGVRCNIFILGDKFNSKLAPMQFVGTFETFFLA